MDSFGENFQIQSVLAKLYTFEKQNLVFVPGRPFYSLSFRNCGQVRINGELNVTFQSILYMPSDTSYTTEVLQTGDAYVVHFTAIGQLPKEPICIQADTGTSIGPLFQKLTEQCSEEQKFKAFATLYTIFDKINTLTSQKQKISKRMLLTKQYIDQNFQNGFISVGQLAEMANISETYFRKEFKNTFGCTPLEYMRKVRISHAVFLLEIGQDNVTDVAMQCGYDNLSYFSYDFRKVIGQPPSKYLKGR